MGRFTLRLPDTLHHTLEEQAKQEGVSLNQYLVYKLTQSTKPDYTVQVVTEVDVKQQHNRLQALMTFLGTPDDNRAREFLDSRDIEEIDDPETETLLARLEAKFPVNA